MEKNTHFNVAVIGQGPAGLTSALYTARSGLSTVVFERMGPGGQMTETEHLDNYPGFAEGVSPFDLAFAMSAQANRFGAVSVNEEISSLDLASSPKKLVTAFGNEYTADVVILAMGGTACLGVNREGELAGKAFHTARRATAGSSVENRRWWEAATRRSATCCIFLASAPRFTWSIVARAALTSAPRMRCRPRQRDGSVNSVVDGLHDEDGKLSAVTVRNVKTGNSFELPTSALFVAVGTQPKNALLEGSGIELDAAGYVVAGESGATSIPGVFVAGDLRTKALRQVSTAVGDGANAANAAFEFLSLS
ncbi:MAG: NAD(P)/FAD-dependent oxidoreductase [Slackia sp.]